MAQPLFNLKPKTISLNPVGSFYNFPNWRFLLFREPSKAGLEYCRRNLVSGAGALKRYLVRLTKDDLEKLEKLKKDNNPPVHLVHESSVAFSFSDDMLQIINRLNFKQKELLYKLFQKKLAAADTRKIFCEVHKDNKIRYWNPKHIDDISDSELRRLLHHCTHVRYDRDVEFALNFHSSKEHERMFKYIGYCIFAGISDAELAKRFKFKLGQIRTLRTLFFDFTHAPTDPVARAAYFTQLSDNNQISDEDRRFYKLISELGELGLKAFSSLNSLTSDEKYKVEEFLASSMLDNVMSLNFAVTDMKDAVAYNSVINNLATFHIKKEEAAYFRSKVRNLDAATNRIINSGTEKSSDLTIEDEQAFALISKLALKENPVPQYRTISALEE